MAQFPSLDLPNCPLANPGTLCYFWSCIPLNIPQESNKGDIVYLLLEFCLHNLKGNQWIKLNQLKAMDLMTKDLCSKNWLYMEKEGH